MRGPPELTRVHAALRILILRLEESHALPLWAAAEVRAILGPDRESPPIETPGARPMETKG